jgi:hypothetical protein
MNISRSLLAVIFVVFPLFQSEAVIVAGGNGTQNDTSTGAGAGWNYVSGFTNSYGSASAVYLGEYGGKYWAIQSRHSNVPTSTLIFNSVVVSFVPNSAIRVLNDPDDPASGTDLLLIQVNKDPGLPNLNLIENPLVVGSAMRLIGNGRNREASLTLWTASWNETLGPGESKSGYKWAAGNTKRWGYNNIDAFGSEVFFANQGMVQYFSSDFDNLLDEGQGSTGDSGGGAFYYDAVEDEWLLAGVMITVGTFQDQPADTAVFGNATYYADISQYRDFILQTIPEPGPVGFVAFYLGLGLLSRRVRSKLGCALRAQCRMKR